MADWLKSRQHHLFAEETEARKQTFREILRSSAGARRRGGRRYAGVAFYHWGTGTLPQPVYVVFGFLDLAFLVLFLYSLREARSKVRLRRA